MGKTNFFVLIINFRVFPKKQDLQAIIKYYDTDGDGNITYEEFLRGLREDLSERRKKIVLKAFSILDKDNSGVVTVSEVLHLYDV